MNLQFMRWMVHQGFGSRGTALLFVAGDFAFFWNFVCSIFYAQYSAKINDEPDSGLFYLRLAMPGCHSFEETLLYISELIQHGPSVTNQLQKSCIAWP